MIINDVRYRFGKESTKIIPENMKLYLVLIENKEFYEMIEFWRTKIYGFDYSYVANLAANNIYVRIPITPQQFLAKPALVANLTIGNYYENKQQFQKTSRLVGLAYITVWLDGLE